MLYAEDNLAPILGESEAQCVPMLGTAAWQSTSPLSPFVSSQHRVGTRNEMLTRMLHFDAKVSDVEASSRHLVL